MHHNDIPIRFSHGPILTRLGFPALRVLIRYNRDYHEIPSFAPSAGYRTDHDFLLLHTTDMGAEDEVRGHRTDATAILLTPKTSNLGGDTTTENVPPPTQHYSLKHSLLGPSLTKSGQDGVDQRKVSGIIYEASKGSKYFNNEEAKDKTLTVKIDRILALKAQLEGLDLKSDLRRADEYIASLELSRDLSQTVVHIDCDAFYAAVEELDRPELRHVPMAVGQGVLTTCNYHARKYGCRSGMAGFVATKLCPELICIPLNFEKYTAKAREVRAVLALYDPRFESASIDEAYLNITEYCFANEMHPETVVSQLREEVHERCKITISAGIAPNAKIAKICSNKNKPNGHFRIPPDRAAIMSFMHTLPIRKVNGVGRVFERELKAVGIETCGDVYEKRAYLTRLFGEKAFQFLLQTYLGLGRTEISPADEHVRKSVGTESTFRDMSDKGELREKLRHTAEELEKDMARTGFKGRTLVLKIKLHTYEVFTRQIAPPRAVCVADDLYNYAVPMLAKLEKEIPDMKLRLMGLRCTHLVSTKKTSVDFFGRHAQQGIHFSGGLVDQRNDDGEWEVWPDTEFEEAERQERQDDIDELERLSQEQEPHAHQQDGPDFHEPFGRYNYGSAPHSASTSPVKPQRQADEKIWDCPICLKPQASNDRHFNEHIDFCLSREIIKEAVANTKYSIGGLATEESSVDVPERPSFAAGKRKKALPPDSGVEKRQKRLNFA